MYFTLVIQSPAAVSVCDDDEDCNLPHIRETHTHVLLRTAAHVFCTGFVCWWEVQIHRCSCERSLLFLWMWPPPHVSMTVIHRKSQMHLRFLFLLILLKNVAAFGH